MTDLDDKGPVRVPRFGLSGKLLVLTILFVMIVQVLIYVPAVSIFRVNWLNDRLAAARTAALVLYAAPSGMVPDDLARDILRSIGAQAVVMKTGQTRRLLAVTEMPAEIHRNFDLREVDWFDAVAGAYHAVFDPGDTILRVVGTAPRDGEFLEILIQNEPLQRAMLRFSRNVLVASLIISASTLALVYLALHFMFVRPMRRITRNIMAFRADPENPSRTIRVSRRNDEIGITERELASMQSNLTSMLHQRSRLAALGLAVSKINHDLRNMLASAQLVSDQLSSVRDPRVQRFAPKLVRTLERAIEFCQSTLSYGRAQEAPPDRRMIPVEPLVEEVRETLGLTPDSNIGWIVSIERGLEMDADHDHMFRVLLNLTRNAMQALEARAPNNALRDQIRVTGRREGGVVVIEVSDTGPGFPPRAREHLFQAFSGSARPGGTGLGLAIAAELVRAHGGEIRLVEGTIGATFHLTIPDQAVDLDAWREERASA
ncbi:HAMP domain-containing sensor histidine kinase [Pseudorhodoplanes sp.]|uniref:sensor histidine kinase n=1 Tax=Pseudorhodoplanes sp. TaxID=1934341 RepID=UPI002C28C5E3|nr:HAMP domain-containing sensor histidine kinase [Pseudorhodoplanes sp.]HWV40207.1 HAMP domain-containing sensor histidine kinase [Pseudorhodoplanes sp.]